VAGLTSTDLFDSSFEEEGGGGGAPRGPHLFERSSLCERGVFEARLPSRGGCFVPLYPEPSRGLPLPLTETVDRQMKA